MKREKNDKLSEPVKCRVCGIPHTEYGGIHEKDSKFICWRCNKKERKRKRNIMPASMPVATNEKLVKCQKCGEPTDSLREICADCIEAMEYKAYLCDKAYEKFLKRDDIGYPDEFTMEQAFRAGWDASCEVHRNG